MSSSDSSIEDHFFSNETENEADLSSMSSDSDDSVDEMRYRFRVHEVPRNPNTVPVPVPAAPLLNSALYNDSLNVLGVGGMDDMDYLLEVEVPAFSPESTSPTWTSEEVQNQRSSNSIGTSSSSKEQASTVVWMDPAPEKKELPMELTHCIVCNQYADSCCRDCYRVAYCNEEHQNEHWPIHEAACINYSLKRADVVKYQGPFQVVQPEKVTVTEPMADGKSKFLITSTVSIPPHQKVLDETPILVCPWPRIPLRQIENFSKEPWKQCVSLSCFGCGMSMGLGNPTNKCCVKCNLPLCSLTSCPGVTNHRSNECIIIQTYQSLRKRALEKNDRTKLLRKGIDEIEFLYQDVMMIRLIKYFMKFEDKKFPEDGGDTLEKKGLQSREWFRLLKIWKFDEEQKLESIRGRVAREHLSEVFSFSLFLTGGDEDLVWRLFCILETNSFSFNLPYKRFNVLCSLLPLMSHSCIPNTHAYLLDDASCDGDASPKPDFLIRVVSGKHITAGAPITFSYVPSIFCSMERQLILLDKYLIWCECNRCLSQSELKTYIGSFLCSTCRQTKATGPQYMLPSQHFVGREPYPSLKSTAAVDLVSADWEDKNTLSSENFQWLCADSSSHLPRDSRHKLSHSTVLRDFVRYEREVVGHLGDFLHADIIVGYTAPLHKNHSIVLKLCEDILRGDFFEHPVPTNIELASSHDLHMICEAKKTMRNIMLQLNPAFNFQGYPVKILRLCEIEKMKRGEGSEPRPQLGRIHMMEDVNVSGLHVFQRGGRIRDRVRRERDEFLARHALLGDNGNNILGFQ